MQWTRNCCTSTSSWYRHAGRSSLAAHISSLAGRSSPRSMLTIVPSNAGRRPLIGRRAPLARCLRRLLIKDMVPSYAGRVASMQRWLSMPTMPWSFSLNTVFSSRPWHPPQLMHSEVLPRVQALLQSAEEVAAPTLAGTLACAWPGQSHGLSLSKGPADCTDEESPGAQEVLCGHQLV